MPLKDANISTIERLRRDPAFAKALLAEAATSFLDGETVEARLFLRDIVNGTIGFEALSQATDIPAKSLHRMLTIPGNPTMDNLSAIFVAVSQHLSVDVVAKASRSSHAA